jgi:hypothetical protein
VTTLDWCLSGLCLVLQVAPQLSRFTKWSWRSAVAVTSSLFLTSREKTRSGRDNCVAGVADLRSQYLTVLSQLPVTIMGAFVFGASKNLTDLIGAS